MKKIAVLTSGGDAPGMNAAVRAIVRVGLDKGLMIMGVTEGYRGLMSGKFQEMNTRSVSNIIQRGGTILKTARAPAFETESGLQLAKSALERAHIDGLIAVGGNGTFRGAIDLAKIWDGQIIGVPGTIDNDLYGTDETIGYDTALNTAMEGIDKIRDTADSHGRYFIIEVMGRHAGFIALNVGIASGAEEVALPEEKTNIEEMSARLAAGKKRGKDSSIIIVAEGDDAGGAFDIAEKLKQACGEGYRVVVLGHLQRGGSPTARDRILAQKLGAASVLSLIDGKNLVMMGEQGSQLAEVPLDEAVSKKKPLDPFLLNLLPTLAK